MRGTNFSGDVWSHIIPTSGVEGGVAESFLEVYAGRERNLTSLSLWELGA